MLRVFLVGAIVCVAAFAVGRHPEFALRDTRGVVHSSDEWNGKKAIVVFFTTTDCPLSNNDVPEMNRTRQDYEARGVAFYAVQADTTIADADVLQHTKDYQFSFPVLFDPHQTLVKMTGASTIPSAAVLTPDGTLLYLGRIDNRVEDFNVRRQEPTRFDLREALDAVLAGKPVVHPRTKAFGCAINPVK
ncbi:MAG TPA: redoxin domain-containing protein [Bryobacteraceae bacterium]|jgi:peroxiredoxin|nr:redoxin domain-containing protein [Bryobacteraceae bacterium]